MTIDEYKNAIIGLVKGMEAEHGCDVDSMELKTARPIMSLYEEQKDYQLKIVII